MSKASTANPSFLEALAQEEEIGRKCDLSKVLETVDADMAAQIRSAMGDSSFTGAAISRTLERYGFFVGEGAVRRCRRTCKCWRASDEG